MARSQYHDVVIDNSGNPIAGVACTVYNVDATGAETTVATIYGTETGSAISNPFSTGADGYVSFWAGSGSGERYNVHLSGAGYSAKVLRFETYETPSTFSAPNPPTVQVFSSGSGTYNRPSGCRLARVRCWAGGGGSGSATGGSSSGAAGGGGGGGAYAEKWIASPNATYPYAVGAGGAASGDGGNTTFGTTLVVADSGKAGTNCGALTVAGQVAGGNGGQSSSCTGDIRMDGEDGGNGVVPVPGTIAIAGRGGGGATGGGGQRQGATTSGSNGVSGNVPGGGASGASALATTTAAAAGGAGLIIVEEYY